MAVRFPVSVRINDGQNDQYVTTVCSNLTWKLTAPGGFHSASMRLDIDPGTFPDLSAADRIWVYGPDGDTLFEGFLDNPGSTAGPGGVSLDISAMGTVVLGSDQASALIYIDRDMTSWEVYAKNVAAASASTSDDPLAIDPDPGLLTGFSDGAVVSTGGYSQIGYPTIRNAGMQVGAFRASYKSGVSDSDYDVELGYSPSVSSGTITLSAGILTGTRARGLYVAEPGSIPTGGVNAVALRMRRTGGATNVSGNAVWTWFDNVAVLGRRKNRNGGNVSGAAGMLSFDGVRADWVVEDLIGRLLMICDPNACTVEAASFLIDQLAFSDPATAADVLDALELYEPDFLWEFLGSTPTGYVFNYRAWPTDVRYEVSIRDGYEAPGADLDLCNRLAVKWVDNKGKDRTTIITAASEPGVVLPGENPTPTVFSPSLRALEAVGRVRDSELITLPEGRGSAENARRAGEQSLAARVNPPRAASVTVRRPIVDLMRGGTAMPYEIRPGYLCRVRETGDVLRVTEVEVDDEDGSASLTLGTPVLTDEQRLVRLAKIVKKA